MTSDCESRITRIGRGNEANQSKGSGDRSDRCNQRQRKMDGRTNNKELVVVLRESPPGAGAAALGANMIENMTIGFKCLNENGTYQWLNRNKAAQLRFAECAKLLGTSFIRSDIFPSCRLRFLYFICMDWSDTRKLHSLIGIPL